MPPVVSKIYYLEPEMARVTGGNESASAVMRAIDYWAGAVPMIMVDVP